MLELSALSLFLDRSLAQAANNLHVGSYFRPLHDSISDVFSV